VAGAPERSRGLQQQGGFANAGVAAQQQHRAAYQAAASDAIEFADSGG
jgi:hypothetical protein